MPAVNSELIGFIIEFLFQYDNKDGTTYVNWYNGVIISILNEMSNFVKVRWDQEQECLGQGEPGITKEKLLASNWNPNKALNGHGGGIFWFRLVVNFMLYGHNY